MSTRHAAIEREYARWRKNKSPLELAKAISTWVEENDCDAGTIPRREGITAPELEWITLSTALAQDDEDVASVRRALKAVADERSFHELRRDHDNFSDLDLIHHFYVTRFLATGSVE